MSTQLVFSVRVHVFPQLGAGSAVMAAPSQGQVAAEGRWKRAFAASKLYELVALNMSKCKHALA